MLFKKKSSSALAARVEKPAAPPHSPLSFLANDTRVMGTVMSTGGIVIDGHIEGNIYGVRVTIGDNGFVQGDVIASEIMAGGRVAGNLRATTVRLHARGVIEGTIDYHTLSVEMGASLNGDCRHSDNPLAGIAEHVTENAVRADAKLVSEQ